VPQPRSEEYQVEYLDMNHRVFDSVEAVVGEHVWNFADFQTHPASSGSTATRRVPSPGTADRRRLRTCSAPVDVASMSAGCLRRPG
jgi:hypothetical protein